MLVGTDFDLMAEKVKTPELSETKSVRKQYFMQKSA
jgi:hypothetical protein